MCSPILNSCFSGLQPLERKNFIVLSSIGGSLALISGIIVTCLFWQKVSPGISQILMTPQGKLISGLILGSLTLYAVGGVALCCSRKKREEGKKAQNLSLSSANPTSLSLLPTEVIDFIFSYLKPEDILQCQLVCKNWNEIICHSNTFQKYLKPYQLFFNKQPIRKPLFKLKDEWAGQPPFRFLNANKDFFIFIHYWRFYTYNLIENRILKAIKIDDTHYRNLKSSTLISNYAIATTQTKFVIKQDLKKEVHDKWSRFNFQPTCFSSAENICIRGETYSNVFLMGDESGVVHFLNLDHFVVVDTFKTPDAPPKTILSVLLAKDMKFKKNKACTLLISGTLQNIHIFDLENKKIESIGADGSHIAAGDKESFLSRSPGKFIINIWDLCTLQCKKTIDFSIVPSIYHLYFNESIAVTGDQKGDIVLWDLYQKKPLTSFSGHNRAIEGIAVCGKNLFTADIEQVIHWDFSDPKKTFVKKNNWFF